MYSNTNFTVFILDYFGGKGKVFISEYFRKYSDSDYFHEYFMNNKSTENTRQTGYLRYNKFDCTRLQSFSRSMQFFYSTCKGHRLHAGTEYCQIYLCGAMCDWAALNNMHFRYNTGLVTDLKKSMKNQQI